jgi:intracellular sulfur oxidation DsrE/DsrF family protein
MNEVRPSDEILNAFVDGQFSPEDRLFTLKSIAGDEGLSREVCHMVQLKELVAMAYRAEVLPHAGRKHPRSPGFRGGWWAAAAGMAALALGAMLFPGLDRDRVSGAAPFAAGGALTADAARTIATVPGDSQRVLLHVTEVDIVSAEGLLDDVEFMFETALLNGQDLQVQMVVHGIALDLVRADLAPFPDRMRALVSIYPGLSFTACGQSLARRANEEGRVIELLPWVQEVESGVHEAARRQAEGWTYIRV